MIIWVYLQRLNVPLMRVYMIITLNDLPKNASIFAEFCLKNYSFDHLIQAAQKGINNTDCMKFSISSDQWKDAIYVAMKTLRENYK